MQPSWWRVVERHRATRWTAPSPDRARSRLCRNRGWNIGGPRRQAGFVRMWKPRAVDLRFFFAGRRFVPFEDSDEENEGEEDRSQSGGTGGEEDALLWRLGLALQPPPELVLRASGPLAWPGALFAYQREGVRALIQAPHLLLADEMGLGKSVMCIAALRVLLHRRVVERNLIVAPASLLEQWRRELRKWAPELRVMLIGGTPAQRRWQWRYRAHITLVSYETLRADWNENETSKNQSSPARVAWGVVALDEAQRIKNRDTDLARLCKKLPRVKSWALTGTPLENRAEDVFSILEFVTGGERAHAISSAALLRPALQRFQLRRRKADVLADLPPKITTDLVLPLSPPQRAAYDRAENEGLIELRGGGRELPIENVLALITRLKQICNFEPVGGASSKLDDLRERLAEIIAAGQKALVFSQFAGQESGARRIARELERFAPLLYTGEMDTRERSRAIDAFNSDAARGVLVLSLRAGGQGLNLQRASYVFHFDRWWNPAAMRQAEDRAHRVGQEQPVHVYRYLMQDTIEARIEDVLRAKAELFDQLVDDASLDAERLFSRQTLFEMVGL